jgi:hypothetical protein
MALLGIDVGRNLATRNADILALGVNWVRAPITRDASVEEMRNRITRLSRRGVSTALVIDSSAIGGMSFEQTAEFYANAYGDIVASFECGNEADADWDGTGQQENPAGNSVEARRQMRRERAEAAGDTNFVDPSSLMEPEEVTALLNAFRARLPEPFELWSGGFCCGQHQYLELPGLDLSSATRISIHPYGKEGALATKIVDDYADTLDSRPWGDRFRGGADSIVITEFGFPSSRGSAESERVQAQQVMGVIDTLIGHPRLNAMILFCYDNDQDQGGFGLKAGADEKAVFSQFQTLAANRPGASTPDPEDHA